MFLVIFGCSTLLNTTINYGSLGIQKLISIFCKTNNYHGEAVACSG